MWHRASQVLEGSTRAMLAVVFSAVLLALTLLCAAGADAQETTAEQTVAQAKDGTTMVTKAQETTEQAGEATIGAATGNENTVAQNRNTFADKPKQSVQQGAQQTQADPAEDDDMQATARAATTLNGQPARITESTSDQDEIVDRIVVSVAGCEVASDASVVVEDNDGTRVTLINGQNVTITPDDDALTIVGNDAGGNLTDLDQNGGDQQFGTEGEVVTGEIVSSSGISCNRDAGGGGGGGGTGGGTGGGGGNNTGNGNGGGGGRGCDGATVVEEVSGTGNRQTSPFDTRGNLFQITSIVNATSDPDLIFFSIDVKDTNGDIVATINQEQPGTESSFVNEEAGRFFLDITAANVEYTVTVEDCADVLGRPVTGPLPPTGGLPVPIVLACMTLLLVGAALSGTVVRRRS